MILSILKSYEKIEYYLVTHWKNGTLFLFSDVILFFFYYAHNRKIEDPCRWNEVQQDFLWFTISDWNIDRIISIEIDIFPLVNYMTCDLRTSRWSIFGQRPLRMTFIRDISRLNSFWDILDYTITE